MNKKRMTGAEISAQLRLQEELLAPELEALRVTKSEAIRELTELGISIESARFLSHWYEGDEEAQ